MQLLCKFHKRICFSFCIIYILRKYVWVVPLRNERYITITEAIKKIDLDANQIKYRLIKTANFLTNHLNRG